MKKILGLLVGLSLAVVPMESVHAEFIDGEFIIDKYSVEGRTDLIENVFQVSDRVVVKQDETHAIVSFTIHNPTEEYYPELYYTPSLQAIIARYGARSAVKYLEHEPVKFALYANETKKIVYDFELPSKLPKIDYAIGFELHTKEHILSESPEMILLEEDTLGTFSGFLMPDYSEYLSTGGNAYKIDYGPNVKSADNVKGYIDVTSTFETSKKIMPQLTIFRRSPVSNTVPYTTSYGEVIDIAPGESKVIEFDIPVMGSPESYLVQVSLIDENMNRVSMQYDFRYVVEGATANIGTIKASQSEDDIEVMVTVIGTADISLLKDVKILCEIYENDNIIMKKETITDLKGEFKDIDMTLENIASEKNKTVKVKAKVIYNEKELAVKETELNLDAAVVGEVPLKDIQNTRYEKAVSALNSLGILNGYPDGTFKPENSVTRAEFATIATKLAKLKLSGNESSAFSDVTEEHWAKSYINACSKNNFVSGYPDGTFKPGNNVKYSEAMTILLNVLGYKDAVNNGVLGWPNNYFMKAVDLGICGAGEYSDISLPATRGDVAILTYNAYLRR